MNYNNVSKAKLIIELEDLCQKNNSLRSLLDKVSSERKKIEAEKERRANELIIANKELIFQNEEMEKRADELIIADNELVFQNEEKEKRAAELIIANKELLFQNKEKEKRAVELLNAKEHAKESDRLKTAFLQNMSHEIRTPMNGILGFAELLKSRRLSGERQQEFIQLIEESGQRMLNIINDIVNISKIETGQIELDLQAINVNQVLNHLYTIFIHEAERIGLSLSYKTSLNDTLCITETDNLKLTQIISNLIKNALKFTKSGNIEFGYRLEDQNLEFYVRDTGIGIESKMQHTIFERFRQVEMSAGRNYEGAGLGLAISKAYVEKLGGKIWVKSELKEGTTFFFNIPYVQGQITHLSD